MTRRRFTAVLAAAPAVAAPKTRAITRSPKFHWFGYYDKLQLDPTNRYNDREQGQFVSHVMNVRTGTKRTLPLPIYAVSPPDPNRDELAPRSSGIWRMDLQTGKHEHILSIADVAAASKRV